MNLSDFKLGDRIFDSHFPDYGNYAHRFGSIVDVKPGLVLIRWDDAKFTYHYEPSWLTLEGKFHLIHNKDEELMFILGTL